MQLSEAMKSVLIAAWRSEKRIVPRSTAGQNSTYRALYERGMVDRDGNLTGAGAEQAEALLGRGNWLPCVVCGKLVITMHSLPTGRETCARHESALKSNTSPKRRRTTGGGVADGQYEGWLK